MLITGIKSRPTYAPLEPDLRGRTHVLVGQGSGGAALLRLLARLPFRLVDRDHLVDGRDLRLQLGKGCR